MVKHLRVFFRRERRPAPPHLEMQSGASLGIHQLRVLSFEWIVPAAPSQRQIQCGVYCIERAEKTHRCQFLRRGASGGYYVAVGAPQMQASVHSWYWRVCWEVQLCIADEKMGIKESFSRGPQANIFSFSKPWNTEQRAVMRKYR